MEALTFGLKISKNARKIGAKIIASNNRAYIKTGLTRIIQNIYNYDNFCFAGRLLINEAVRTVSSIQMYLTLNDEILNDDVKKFIRDNAEVLDLAVKNSEKFNYINTDFFSADTFTQAYLIHSVSSKGPTESPVLMRLRIATQMYYDVGLARVLEVMNEMNDSCYTHASPTMSNAGTKKPQMASCFLMSVADNLFSMMYGLADMAIISSMGGGIGMGFNPVRHSDIAGTGDSVGLKPFMQVADKTIGYASQTRKRRGATTGFHNIWHLDSLDIIEGCSKFIPQEMQFVDVTPCVWAHNLFFERCRKKQNWTLFCPNTVKSLNGKYGMDFEKEYLRLESLVQQLDDEYFAADKLYDKARSELAKTDNPTKEQCLKFTEINAALKRAAKARIVYKIVPALDILRKTGTIQLKSGKPYVMNGDRCNMKSNQQNYGPINQSNLCVEVVQYCDPDTYTACNLASMNLPRYAKGRYSLPKDSDGSHGTDDSPRAITDEDIMKELARVFDFEFLGRKTQSVTYNIDKVIDHNLYPLSKDKIEDFNKKSRPLGIGASGLDDAFKILDLVYGSRESIILNKMIFACMYYNALQMSNLLAEEFGEYPLFRTGKFKMYDPEIKAEREYSGSPLANGLFQFDMWQREYELDETLDRNNKLYYDPKDNIPIDPKFFGGSCSWDELREIIKVYGVRNSLLLAMMPTASTAQIMRNAESMEAHQSNIYSRQVGIGSYTIINRHLYGDLDEIGLHKPDIVDFIYNNVGKLDGIRDFVFSKYPDSSADTLSRLSYLEKKYQTMFDIKPSTFLLMARQRGIYVDQSQSTNIFILDPTPEQLMGVQLLAYYYKLKTHCYYVRNAIATANTCFNKVSDESKLFGDDEPSSVISPVPVKSKDIPACKIDNPECFSCGA